MSLRQNKTAFGQSEQKLSYQSECHCAKTSVSTYQLAVLLSYQSECHCAKTEVIATSADILLSYQSECHCAKTG